MRGLVAETDSMLKKDKFQESFHATLDKAKQPLPSMDAEQNTHIPFKDVTWIEQPKIVRVGYRSFDRQYIVADSRLIHSPSNPLWSGRVPGQIFGIEQHAHYPKAGPAMMYSALIPDMDFFRGSEGGRAVPFLHPDGSANVAPGMNAALKTLIGPSVDVEDLFFYVSGITSHPGFVQLYDDELHTPGVRIPITTDLELWEEAVRIGRHVVWLHTFGAQGTPPAGTKEVTSQHSGITLPSYVESVKVMPTEVQYDSIDKTLHIGGGTWSEVSPEVREYTVGGMNVVDSWVGYRRLVPKGRKTKKSSPLESLVQTKWPGEWSIELTEILAVLTQLVAIESSQNDLLLMVNNSEKITIQDFSNAGVKWPKSAKERRPKLPLHSHFFEDESTGA